MVTFDLEALNKDVADGMYFDSSIPQGYGVGSSGALVAAIYDKYTIEKITVLENLTREKLLKLKTIFGKMESFFHGKSSGLDPLNSYLSLHQNIRSGERREAVLVLLKWRYRSWRILPRTIWGWSYSSGPYPRPYFLDL